MKENDLARWEIVDRQLVADGAPWFKVYRERIRLPGGRIVQDYYIIDQADHVCIFALTGPKQVLTLWHYKHGPKKIALGFPSGYVKQQETPLDAAQRELLEESGFEAGEWTYLCAFSVDGNRGSGKMHAFMARNLRKKAEPDADDLEEYFLEETCLQDLRRHIEEGNIATLSAVMLAALGLLTLQTKET